MRALTRSGAWPLAAALALLLSRPAGAADGPALVAGLRGPATDARYGIDFEGDGCAAATLHGVAPLPYDGDGLDCDDGAEPMQGHRGARFGPRGNGPKLSYMRFDAIAGELWIGACFRPRVWRDTDERILLSLDDGHRALWLRGQAATDGLRFRLHCDGPSSETAAFPGGPGDAFGMLLHADPTGAGRLTVTFRNARDGRSASASCPWTDAGAVWQNFLLQMPAHVWPGNQHVWDDVRFWLPEDGDPVRPPVCAPAPAPAFTP